MNCIRGTLAVIGIILAVVLTVLSSYAYTETQEHQDSENLTTSQGEHDRDGDEHSKKLALSDTYDKIRNGARLILSYHAKSNAFKGTVENTTEKTLKRVRVEVHLSNGKELGPTTPTNLAPGAKTEIQLTATSKDFDGWTAHPEVGTGEHGHGEGHGEHGREGREEHKKEHR